MSTQSTVRELNAQRTEHGYEIIYSGYASRTPHDSRFAAIIEMPSANAQHFEARDMEYCFRVFFFHCPDQIDFIWLEWLRCPALSCSNIEICFAFCHKNVLILKWTHFNGFTISCLNKIACTGTMCMIHVNDGREKRQKKRKNNEINNNFNTITYTHLRVH